MQTGCRSPQVRPHLSVALTDSIKTPHLMELQLRRTSAADFCVELLHLSACQLLFKDLLVFCVFLADPFLTTLYTLFYFIAYFIVLLCSNSKYHEHGH